MPVRIRPAHAFFKSRASNGDARPDDRLALVDQAFFAGHRAAGQKDVMQVVWLYEHPIDLDGLRRFHHNLGYGLLGRRIERSPLPFARPRWVLDRGPSEIEFAERARPRTELGDWADERSQLPTDPEWGPGWHLAVLPLTDGSTAVSLVASHYLLDGIGLVVALIDALMGTKRELGYSPPRSRTPFRAVIQDLRRTARDTPAVARALVAAPKLVRLGRPDGAPPAPRPVAVSGGGGDEPVIVPGVTISVDLDEWDARANALGATSNTLAAGLAAKLGEHTGYRHGDDGPVTVQLVMSDRTEGDARAVAVSLARVHIDPMRVTTDLSAARADIKQTLKTLRETPHESSALEALTPFTPKWTWRRAVDNAFADPDHPVVCSNIGDVGSIVSLLDGTHCDYAFARGTRQHVTRRWLERIGGQMQLLSMRVPMLGKIFIHILVYQPGAENTKPALRELAKRTLGEFDLTGDID